jgi:RNA polymerase sigma factor (sigma-70 family)
MSETNQWLRKYVETGSEEAFREVIAAHMGLVHSTALRLLRGDQTLAADCTQMVFADLARKAKSLPANVVLPGWLYRHTQFTATKLVRGEARRRIREKAAMTALDQNDDSDSMWNRLEPMLDEALNWLSARDRDAILMRFFQKQEFRAVAAAMHSTEAAAQKRVERAIEKLRRFFEARGVTVSSGVLGTALTLHTVSAPPASVAAAVSASAVAQASTAVPLLSSVIEKLILMAKVKTIAAGTVVIIGMATPLLLQHRTISSLRAENESLRAQAQPVQPQIAAATQDATLADADRRELLQLRGEVARLRREQSKAASLEAENKRLRAQGKTPSAPAATQQFVPSDQWADVGFGSPAAALQTAHWAIRTGNIEKFKESMFITDAARNLLHSLLEKMQANAPGEAIAEIKKRGWGAEEGLLFPMMALDRKHGFTGYRVLSQSSPQPDEILFEIQTEMNSAPAETRNYRMKQFGDSWRQVLDIDDLPLTPEEKQKALAGTAVQPN